MSEQEDVQKLVDEFCAIADRLRLTHVDVAAAAGISAPTVRILRATHEIPKHTRCIDAVRNFVERNRHATRRDEVRLAS